MKKRNKEKKAAAATETNYIGGIKIGETLKIVQNRKPAVLDRLWLVVLAFFGIFGFFGSLISIFDIHYDTTASLIGLILLFFFSAPVFSSKKKSVFIIGIAIFAVFYIMFVSYYSYEILNGLKLFVNSIVEETNMQSLGVHGFYVRRTVRRYESLTCFAFAFFALVELLLCYGTIKKKSFQISFIASFPFLEIGFFFGLAPDYLPFCVLLSYWIALAIMSIAGFRDYKGSKQCDFVRRRESFLPKSTMEYKSDASSAFTVFVASALAFSLIAGAISAFDFNRPITISNLRSFLKDESRDFSIKEAIGNIISNSDDNNDEERLGSTGTLRYKNVGVLSVTLSAPPQSTFYLRDGSKAVYSGTTWDGYSDETVSNYAEMFKTFNTIGFSPQNGIGFSLISLSALENELPRLGETFPDNYSSYYPLETCTVSLLDARDKTEFFPYGICSSQVNFNYDLSQSSKNGYTAEINGKNCPTHSCTFTPFDIDSVLSTFGSYTYVANDYGSYSDLMSEYESFVSDNYLLVPQSKELETLLSRRVYSDVLFAYRSGAANAYQTLCSIRELIYSKAEYTLSPGKAPEDVDFVYWFLEENHKGYCVHYATAGVILARMAGIPARYATGFAVQPDAFSSDENGSSSATIKDNAAHAWAEIYIYGIGWIPFEFTEPAEPVEQTETTTMGTSVTTAFSGTRQTTKSTGSSYKTNASTAYSSSVHTTSTALLGKSDEQRPIFPLVMLCMIFAFVFILALCVPLFRKRALIKRKRSFSTKSESLNALNAYGYIISLLGFAGIVRCNSTDLEFAENAEKESDFFESGELTKISKVALKASFGAHGVEEGESCKVVELANSLAAKIYDSCGTLLRFRMKYIERLI